MMLLLHFVEASFPEVSCSLQLDLESAEGLRHNCAAWATGDDVACDAEGAADDGGDRRWGLGGGGEAGGEGANDGGGCAAEAGHG